MSGTTSLASYVFSPPAPGANTNLQGSQVDSPWNSSSPVYGNGGIGTDYDYDDLRLPPINPDADAEDNYDLPPFVNNPQFFGIGQQQRSLSPSLGLINPSSPASASRPREEEQEQEPPPSNQQARRQQQHHHQHQPSVSQYRVPGSESPDPFDEAAFLDLQHFPELFPSRSPSVSSHSRNTTRRSSFVDLTESSPAEKMAPSRKRKADDGGAAGKATKAARKTTKRPSIISKREGSLEGVEVVDLAEVETDEQYKEATARQQAEMLKKQQQDEATRPFKLAEFNCIICMDNPTSLTVTHCGHMFCSECLHQALHAGDKKACPVCRTTISTTMSGREGHKRQPKNGIFALEMKLMTANKKGKRPVRAS
ncbi:uncharacterized protein BP5553_04093 [Venustampulla echinocandica]|uniref:RING-type domain-containing protein n=1 Tax=Venustampulla echinocandica TaxID=2656787 RepID=A0A370TW41_9HELO|nr:uncharacterized protein BP5553_04093 [Venustampulla echinocandica]RDL39753.1 hypothetical protein BP5553_04093 [Venustampulla echinocandica]